MMHSCCCIYFILRCGIYFIWIRFEFLFEKGFEKQIKKRKGKEIYLLVARLPVGLLLSFPVLGCEDGPLPCSPSRRWAGPGSQVVRLILFQPLTGGPRWQPNPLPPVVTGMDSNKASTESNLQSLIS
jgi:hypothetical protein